MPEQLTLATSPEPEEVLAITLWQPWASAAAYAIKTWETRSWLTHHRGLLAIHAAAAPVRKEGIALFNRPDVRARFEYFGITDTCYLPYGQVLALVDVGELVRTEVQVQQLSELEVALGIYKPGRWAWPWTNVRRLVEPIAAKGGQRLWRWKPPAGLHSLPVVRHAPGGRLTV